MSYPTARPSLFGRTALLAAALIASPVLSPLAFAQDKPAETEEEREARAIREAQKRLQKQEEMFLRIQLEQQLNKVARWDADSGEIRLQEQNLSGVEIPLELLLEEICEPAGRGERVRFKDDVKVRPFATAIQRYMAKGGMDDVERIQKGETPFEGGIPDRVTDLLAELLDALNEQQDLEEAERQEELAKEQRRRELQDQLADRMGMDKEQAERYGKILRQLVRRLERPSDGRGAVERVRDFALSPRAERLTEKIRDSEAVQGASKAVEENLDRFLQSEQAQEIQRQLESYLESEDGAQLRERLEELFGGDGSLRDRLEGLRRGNRTEPAPPAKAEPKKDQPESSPKGEPSLF